MTQAEESLPSSWLQYIPKEEPTGVMGRLDTVPSWFAQNQPTTSYHQNQDSSSRCMAELLLEANWGEASWRKRGERVGGKEGGGEKERERVRGRERERRGTLADWWAGGWLC